MNYRLRGNFSKEPEQAMYDILKNRNVEDVEMYLQPTKDSELNPYLSLTGEFENFVHNRQRL